MFLISQAPRQQITLPQFRGIEIPYDKELDTFQ